MKTKLISKTFFNLLGMSFFLLGISSCTSSSDESLNQKTKSTTTQFEAVYKYLPPDQGVAIMYKNHFTYFYGNSDSTMVTESGTYKVLNDTVYCKVLFSSNPKGIGSEFKWGVESIKGDTLTYVVYSNDGEIIFRGKELIVK